MVVVLIVEKSFGGNLSFEQTTIVLNICIILVVGGSKAESWSLLRCYQAAAAPTIHTESHYTAFISCFPRTWLVFSIQGQYFSILVNFSLAVRLQKNNHSNFLCVPYLLIAPPVTAILLIGWPSQLQFRSNMKMNLKANRPSQSTTHHTYAQLCRKAWDSHGEIVTHH